MDNFVNLNNFTNTNNIQSIINVSQLQMMHCNIMSMMILKHFAIINPIVPILQKTYDLLVHRGLPTMVQIPIEDNIFNKLNDNNANNITTNGKITISNTYNSSLNSSNQSDNTFYTVNNNPNINSKYSFIHSNIISMTPHKQTAISPTIQPAISPTLQPAISPTKIPTITPTNIPTITPSISPTKYTNIPSISPTNIPSISPTLFTLNSSNIPTKTPSNNPTISPSNSPSILPTITPTNDPTNSPTVEPTYHPSYIPTIYPTNIPTIYPSLTIKHTYTSEMIVTCPYEGKCDIHCGSDETGCWGMTVNVEKSELNMKSYGDVAYAFMTVFGNVSIYCPNTGNHGLIKCNLKCSGIYRGFDSVKVYAINSFSDINMICNGGFSEKQCWYGNRPRMYCLSNYSESCLMNTNDGSNWECMDTTSVCGIEYEYTTETTTETSAESCTESGIALINIILFTVIPIFVICIIIFGALVVWKRKYKQRTLSEKIAPENDSLPAQTENRYETLPSQTQIGLI